MPTSKIKSPENVRAKFVSVRLKRQKTEIDEKLTVLDISAFNRVEAINRVLFERSA